MEIIIEQITDEYEKEAVTRFILEALKDWFEIPSAVERYISDSKNQIMLAAKKNGKPVGFLCLKETGKDTVEVAVMGVLKDYHRQGIGRSLIYTSKKAAAEKGYSFMQVKTVQMGKYEEYDKTNLFYRSVGFKEFEIFPTLWDESNPCQVYVMSLKYGGEK